MSNAGNVVDLQPHTQMTPDEALGWAKRRDWEHVVIVGFTKDSQGLVAVSSHMPRESALWIAEHYKLHVLGKLDD